MKTYLYRATNLKSTITFLCIEEWRMTIKFTNCRSCDLFILIIIIIFFRRVFLECTEAIATSLIPLVTSFPEICAFIIDFRYTVWTKMRFLRAH